MNHSFYSVTYDVKFSAGAIAIDGSDFSDGRKSVLVGMVECTGVEGSLSDCPHESGLQTCLGVGGAGVVCQGKGIAIMKYDTLRKQIKWLLCMPAI